MTFTSKPRVSRSVGLAMVLALALSGCASAPESHPFEQGWRVGRVLKPQVSGPLDVKVRKDCREELPDSSSVFALVDHSVGGSPNMRRRLVVPVPQGLVLQAGQRIRIKTNDCAALIEVL